MQYINKNDAANQAMGHQLVGCLIECSWDNVENKHINLEYTKLPDVFKDLLIAEQNGVCCYCMRKLSHNNPNPLEQNFTYEHVIPKQFTSPGDDCKIDPYRHIMDCSNISFINSHKPPYVNKIAHPPYPHFIAYENLTGSCDGRVYDWDNKGKTSKSGCCNNPRGSDQIIPLFFIEDIKDKISYAADGMLDWDDRRFDDTIESVKLNDKTLCFFRKTWYLASKKINKDDILNADESEKKDIADDLFPIDSQSAQLLLKPNLWTLFLQFDWFYDYYKSRVAVY